MGILIGIVLIVVVALTVGVFTRGRKVQERQQVLERRVDAYMQTIRREGDNAELSAMSDPELRDVLLSGARNLRLESERKWVLMIGGAALVLLAAIMVGTQDGTRGFGITAVIGALVLYGLNIYLGRRMREPLAAKGIDIERLRVE